MLFLVRNVEEQGTRRLFESAAGIIEEAIIGSMEPKQSCPALPETINLARRVNWARQKLRPRDPTDLHFVLDSSHVTDEFLMKDVSNDTRRHVVLASDTMLYLLVDATFKVVKKLSIHTFVKSGTCTKQVPLAFTLMSGKRRSGYVVVLKGIIDLLPNRLVWSFAA
ncbi:hypothetical protein LSH36_834g02085 [Paralvinella palmiformis]|uniref:Uncharacterized protein n=1 Tax=Paralvinella palmiformis TaxID=53620 RepID=A0AAD9J024_9ANNE|nr:hypothetical protein LSH36_834g02085 [Paralvinella palmiformis]